MTARAQIEPDFDIPQHGSQLASDIARAMQYRPLMSRLSRDEPFAAPAEEPLAPAASEEELAASSDEFAVPAREDPRSLEEIIDDLSCPAMAPPSAEWLERARLEQRQNRKRHVVAWVKTCAIALAIVAPALVFLRA